MELVWILDHLILGTSIIVELSVMAIEICVILWIIGLSSRIRESKRNYWLIEKDLEEVVWVILNFVGICEALILLEKNLTAREKAQEDARMFMEIYEKHEGSLLEKGGLLDEDIRRLLKLSRDFRLQVEFFATETPKVSGISIAKQIRRYQCRFSTEISGWRRRRTELKRMIDEDRATIEKFKKRYFDRSYVQSTNTYNHITH